MLPIGEVVVAFGSSDPNGEEAVEIAEQERAAAVAGSGRRVGGTEERSMVRVWERLERSLNPSATTDTKDSGDGSGSAVFLWFRRVSEEVSLSWSAHTVTVRGDEREGSREREERDGWMKLERQSDRQRQELDNEIKSDKAETERENGEAGRGISDTRGGTRVVAREGVARGSAYSDNDEEH